jgi:hypothetical protein
VSRDQRRLLAAKRGRDSAALSEGGRCKIEGPGPIWRDHVWQGEGAGGEGRSGWLGSVRYRVQASQWDRGPWDVGDVTAAVKCGGWAKANICMQTVRARQREGQRHGDTAVRRHGDTARAARGSYASTAAGRRVEAQGNARAGPASTKRSMRNLGSATGQSQPAHSHCVPPGPLLERAASIRRGVTLGVGGCYRRPVSGCDARLDE